MHYVYLLISEKDGNFYTGSTNDLKRRFEEHNSGRVNSTENRRPLKLIYYEACLNETDTRNRERYLKSGMGKKYLRNRLRNYLEDL
jgi:putative endonuclease